MTEMRSEKEMGTDYCPIHKRGHIIDSIELKEGHKLIDNKRGDYDLICPDKGNCGFVPFYTAKLLTHCRGCGKKVR